MSTRTKFWDSGDLKDFYDGPFFDRLSTRRSRRLLAVAFMVTLSAYPLVAWWTGNVWLVATVILPYAVTAVLLQGSTRGVTELRNAKLDERQRNIRDRIYRPAFFIGIVVAFLGGLALATRFVNEPELSTAPMLGGLSALSLGFSLLLWGFLMLLPALLLAWILPDEVRDEG